MAQVCFDSGMLPPMFSSEVAKTITRPQAEELALKLRVALREFCFGPEIINNHTLETVALPLHFVSVVPSGIDPPPENSADAGATAGSNDDARDIVAEVLTSAPETLRHSPEMPVA